jgi:hypothetical protein
MLNDLLVCAGVAVIGVGLWIAWPPLGLCAVGAGLIVGGVVRASDSDQPKADA